MTHLRQFADYVFHGRLDAFVKERRSKGTSWERIAKEIWDETDHRINLSGQTLRGWYTPARRKSA
jgi:hypothetical protein